MSGGALPTTSYKISEKKEKTIESIPRKTVAIVKEQANQAILGHFGPFSGKWEFSQKTWLSQLWVLLVPQLHAKCHKKQTNKQTNKQSN